MIDACSCRADVAAHLGLQPDQLPLLASLCGNDYVSEATLLPWHQSLGVVEHQDVFQPVASRIAACSDDDGAAVVAEVCRFVAEPQSFGSQLAFSLKERIPAVTP